MQASDSEPQAAPAAPASAAPSAFSALSSTMRPSNRCTARSASAAARPNDTEQRHRLQHVDRLHAAGRRHGLLPRRGQRRLQHRAGQQPGLRRREQAASADDRYARQRPAHSLRPARQLQRRSFRCAGRGRHGQWTGLGLSKRHVGDRHGRSAIRDDAARRHECHYADRHEQQRTIGDDQHHGCGG